MTRQDTIERDARLRQTPAGAALLDFVSRWPTQAALNAELKLRPNIISQCIMRGQISRPLARQIEKKMGIPKEQLRPDLSADEWAMGDPGKKPGRKVKREGEDQQTLLMLTEHFGSVAGIAAASKYAITVADYHRWMSRNRIPGHALPILLKMRISPAIRERLAA